MRADWGARAAAFSHASSAPAASPRDFSSRARASSCFRVPCPQTGGAKLATKSHHRTKRSLLEQPITGLLIVLHFFRAASGLRPRSRPARLAFLGLLLARLVRNLHAARIATCASGRASRSKKSVPRSENPLWL